MDRLARLLALALLVAGCQTDLTSDRDARAPTRDGGPGATDAASPPSDAGAPRDDAAAPTPDAGPADAGLPPRPLPDLGALDVDCARGSVSDLGLARRIYDETFGDALPASDEDFGWHVDPSVLTPERVDRITFGPLPEGETVDRYHALLDFDPARFDRTTATDNDTLFGAIDALDPHAPYERFNPTDAVPATATHYGRSETSDVMANQLVYRVACDTERMERAFARCPDCVDVFTALSRHDLGQVFELRFVRVEGGALEVSRPFRVISVDASGHVTTHATDPARNYLFARLGGETLRARWRGELSGRLATQLGRYGGPTPMLIRRVE
ncbi:MAG TPA: hypothetical protein RMH99_26520 [Sandaracinaceae bacterium LLY-WYZ-13_1]|nr:hypothetical protein [Sandaracinaceae bacterium LLY-WYZ-13_1]